MGPFAKGDALLLSAVECNAVDVEHKVNVRVLSGFRPFEMQM